MKRIFEGYQRMPKIGRPFSSVDPCGTRLTGPLVQILCLKPIDKFTQGLFTKFADHTVTFRGRAFVMLYLGC